MDSHEHFTVFITKVQNRFVMMSLIYASNGYVLNVSKLSQTTITLGGHKGCNVSHQFWRHLTTYVRMFLSKI